ncbi:hypothetical protein CFOL_v3_19336, partial [Cephalotus follicularis]
KTQSYYEFILVDTNSIKINPKSNPKHPGLITHTSVFIQKVLTLSEWGQNPHYFKQFTASFDLPIYNYFDYMDAWKNTFLFQNIENRHSWFFCFDKTFKKQTIPCCFVDWWCFYGPIEEILSPPIIEAFNTFTKHTIYIYVCVCVCGEVKFILL